MTATSDANDVLVIAEQGVRVDPYGIRAADPLAPNPGRENVDPIWLAAS